MAEEYHSNDLHNTTLRATRSWRAVVAAGLVLTLCARHAASQEPETATERGNRLAYAAAQKCFVVIGILVGDAKDSGKIDLAGQYDQKARRSFDFALQLGAKLGLSGTTMNEDFGLAQAHELPKLIADKSYFTSSADTCKALGLL